MATRRCSVLPCRMLEYLEPRVLLSNQAIWVEGESPTSTTFNHGWLEGAANLDRSQLSPGIPGTGTLGTWLTHWTNVVGSAQAVYTFNVAEAGTYTFWARLQTFFYDGNTTYSVKFDSGSFTAMDTADVASQQNLHSPNTGNTADSFDGRVAGWVLGGSYILTAGSHTVTIRVSNTYGTLLGGIDALAFTNYSWAPTGPFRPNPTAPTPGASDWFAFGAGPDPFSSSSIIDLSYLNEDVAGSHGALRRVGSGYQFTDGTPVKFWGVDASPTSNQAHMDAQARWYAKNGINIVRLAHFDGFFDTTQRDAQGNVVLNAAKLDQYDRFFAALKNNGIYSDWSMVWQTPVVPADGYPTGLYNELPSTTGGKNTYGVVNFMTQLQDIRWKFMGALLNHVNPYTGLKYANDPALAIVEVQNEDDIFFWNPLGNVVKNYTTETMPLHKDELQKLWQQWIKAKYVTTSALQTAWGSGFRNFSGDGYGPDGVDNLNMKLYDAWEMGATGLPSWEAQEQKRLADFMKFLGDTQRGYYQRRTTQFRNAGFQGVVVATNWLPGGEASKAPNLWADDTADAIDRHGYWGEGEGSWRIVTYDADGDGIPGEFQSASMLFSPGGGLLNAGMYQVEDKPFNYSEWSAVPPNQYKAEAAPLMAFYGLGLQGWDASFHFASSRYYYGNGWGNTIYTSLYNSDTPAYMGQFTALALAVRQGHIAEGGTAAARRISYNNAFAGNDALTQTITNGGWNGVTGSLSVNNEVLGIGRVTTKIADGQPASQKNTWTNYWNSTNKTINSTTGELAWDYNLGLVQVKAPKTQAIIGFAGGRNFDLPDFSINVNTNFVDLIFTALDNLPIAQSNRILITALARDTQYGATYNVNGTQLTSMGGEPLMLEPVQATITLKGRALQTVRVVDVYGVPTSQTVSAAGNTFTIDGRYATFYYEITRQADTTPPQVTSVRINDGSVQRSMVTEITVTFSEDVTLLEGAISLLLSRGGQVPGTALAVDSTDAHTYVLTFSGTSVVGDSLADGRYKIVVTAAKVTDGGGNAMSADSSTSFFRLFGDSNGDMNVNNTDLRLFKQVYNKTYNPAYWYFDYDNNDSITNYDYQQLKLRLTKLRLL